MNVSSHPVEEATSCQPISFATTHLSWGCCPSRKALQHFLCLLGRLVQLGHVLFIRLDHFRCLQGDRDVDRPVWHLCRSMIVMQFQRGWDALGIID